jgi:hypothetical protein
MTVAVGLVADELGAIHQSGLGEKKVGEFAYTLATVHNFYSLPSTEYRSSQPARIEIDCEHDHHRIGEVRTLELDEQQRLWAVCKIDLERFAYDSTPWYFSSEVRHLDGRDIELVRLSVVRRPGSVGTRPVMFHPGELRGRTWPHRTVLKEMLTRASEAPDTTWSRGPTIIRNAAGHHSFDPWTGVVAVRRSHGPLEHSRHVGQVLHVR